jgi:N-methylhydantoinase A/oxoprolinase/acetone carboxylase beta subunit
MSTDTQPLFLGIDTGGTFTDGVLLEPISRRVVRSVKELTTHHNLELCIARVLDRLVPEDPSCVTFVSLSTTLATNAIAEGKRRPVGLLLMGYDPTLVHDFNFQEQFGTHHYHFIRGRHTLDGTEQEKLDETALARLAHELKDKVDAFAVSSYAGPRNASHEERAAEILADLTNLPVVQAHHLSNELDSILRATTASLNASLLSNTQEFLNAVQSMLELRGIRCPVMIVRGDGSIVKADYARKRPVEIIHSGPATSAIGGQFLANVDTSLVIDIGGTTTDIALIDHGLPPIEENAATVGPFRTCVKTIKVRSFGLGGDSLIRFDRWKTLSVGPERVLPLSYLSFEFPLIRQDLQDWLSHKKEIVYSDRLEYWVLRREPSRPVRSERARRALELLRGGPVLLAKLLRQVGAVSPVQLHMDEFVNEEAVQRAGFTPTDLLHITGEFTPWDTGTARLITGAAARIWNESAEAFADRVKRAMTRRITAEVVQFLSACALSDASLNLHHNHLDRWLFEESISPQDAFLGCKINLKIPIVGIGAPAASFLPAVAETLGTQFILPEHFAVANAVGTVVGSVIIQESGTVSPQVSGTVITGYFARVGSRQEKFSSFEAALAYARRALIDQVAVEAAAAGADAPAIECQETEVIPGMMVSLNAYAVGKPNITNQQAS